MRLFICYDFLYEINSVGQGAKIGDARSKQSKYFVYKRCENSGDIYVVQGTLHSLLMSKETR